MFADAQTLAGSILTTDQNGQTETVIYTYPEQIQQFQLTWIKSLDYGKLKNRPCVFRGWSVVPACRIVLFMVFFILWLRQNFFSSIVHSGVRIACCFFILNWSNNQHFSLFFTEYQGSAMMQNHCVPLSKILLNVLHDVEFLLKVGTTITLWILAIMIEKSVINVLQADFISICSFGHRKFTLWI
jgi:hypothetical protein